MSTAISHNMLRTLWEISEGKWQYDRHHSATLDALHRRGLIQTPLESGRWCGAVTPAGEAVLDAAPRNSPTGGGGENGPR